VPPPTLDALDLDVERRDTTNLAIIPAGPPSHRASDPPSRKKTFLVNGSASRALFYVPDINRTQTAGKRGRAQVLLIFRPAEPSVRRPESRRAFLRPEPTGSVLIL
jgi:hypothetical protein